MANRFPLVLDTSSGNKIAEIAAGDNLDLRQTSIVDVQDITALGNINAASVSVNGQDIKPGVFTDLTDAPNSYTGNENFIIRVNSAGTGLEFFQLGGDAQPLSVTDLAISGDIQPTVAPGGDIGSTTQGFNAIFANYFQGSIKGNNGSTVFDAATNQIPYSVIVGGPTAMSDLTNDLGFVTNAQLNDGTVTVEIKNTGDLQGSVFGEDSTLLVDHINGRINAARLTRNGANDGQTIVWNTATELWEPGTAGDITGFASNKTDTLTVQDGYKITFAAAIGNIEGSQINITPAVGYTVDLGNTRMQANAGIQPTNNAEGAIGTASKKFNEGHFVTLTADTLLGAFQGDLVNDETRSNAIVAGDKTAANGGYGFHLVNTTGGVTNASLNFNSNDLIAANLVNATGEISGNVYGDDSTILVDGLNNKIRGDIEFAVTEGYIAGKNINITPEGGYFVKLGNTEVTGTVTPAVDGAGNLGTVSKKFGQGYFTTVNATTIDADNVIADVLTATSFNITGSGVGTFSSGGDLVIDTGNRIILQGGPAKFPILTTTERDAFPTIDADTIYNSTDDRFQFRQNGQWITLHEGNFNGDVIGNVTGDLTGNITGADRNGAVAPADVTITAGDETTASQNGADVTISGGAPGAGGTHGGVNIGNAAGANQIDGDTTFGNNVIVTGNMTVSGTTTTINTEEVNIADNIIILNSNFTGAGPTESGGIEIERGDEANKSFVWNETTDKWTLGTETLVAGTVEAAFIGTFDGEVTGSVFGDDSTVLVDGNNNKIVGPVETHNLRTTNPTIALGYLAGQTNQGNTTVAIGSQAGNNAQNAGAVGIGYKAGNASQGLGAIALGYQSGQNTQGDYGIAIGELAGQATQGGYGIAIGYQSGQTTQGADGIAIGRQAGFTNQAANSIVLNATGSAVENTTASSLVIKPIRSAASANVMMYDDTSGEVTQTATPGTLAADIDKPAITIGAATATTIDIGNAGSTTTVNGTVQFTSALIANNLTADDSISILTSGNTANEAISIGPQGSNTAINLTADSLRFNGVVTTTINATGGVVGDLQGSIYADDSTLMIDSVNGQVTGDVSSNLVRTPVIRNLTSGTNIDVRADGFLNLYGSDSDVTGVSNIQMDTQGINYIELKTEPTTPGDVADVAKIAINAFTAAGDVQIGTEGASSRNQSVDIYNATVTGTLIGNVIGTLAGSISGDVTGSIYGDDSSQIIDGIAGKIVGPISKIVGDVQQISGPGAISLDTLVTEITTTGTDDAYSLADGVVGQIKIIAMVGDGGDAVLTPTTFANGTDITFEDVNDNITLLFTSNGWLSTANQGNPVIA